MDPKDCEEFFDTQFAEMEMPAEYKDYEVIILCNDCFTKSKVPFHVLGGKCKECSSYNTTRIDSDVEKLDDDIGKSNKENNWIILIELLKVY